MQKRMSKLQVRAEVLMMLQQLSLFEDAPKVEIDKYVAQFQSSENIDDILEILLKELGRSDIKKSQIIAYFLVELGNLEILRDGLWNYIKDPAISDDLKDLSGVILKSLGDESSPEELLSYLNSPDELVDKETQKLLEIASVNPEAQIDFLDFLFSLPLDEQINLINSMKDDFTNKYLANVFVPALESNPSENLSAIIIDALGQIRSPYAVSCLNDIVAYSNNENLKKLAKKSLNMLKISGIDMEQALKIPLGTEICNISGIYNCYASIIDGAGNQGIIVSRMKDNGDILTFSTVINDIEGIIDCFGFYGISQDDYTRIINKFQGELAAVPVSPGYCKYKLLQAEHINKTLNNAIRYEYLSWKSLLSDVDAISIEAVAKNLPVWSNSTYLDDTNTLFSHPEFKYWFLGDDHSAFLKSFLSDILQDVLKNRDNYINDSDGFLNLIENKINNAIPKVFNNNLIILYKLRLTEVAYLFDIQGIEFLRNIAASVAMQLRKVNEPDCSVLFFEYIMKKSVIEYVLRYQYRLDQKVAPVHKSFWKKKEQADDIDFDSQELKGIIDILVTAWRKEEND
ncbi:MAG: hypothetical protein PHC34_05910 [Candidatus Gastranaerophilales bacterium]|nr:hypothetical protein [Candidatus Gastranaerophilales bacterium]